MVKKETEKCYVMIVALVSGALLIEGLILLALQVIFSQRMTMALNIITIIISITLGMIVFPYILMQKSYKVILKEMGISGPTRSTFFFFLGAVALIIATVIVKGSEQHIVFWLILQNLFVALGEEFTARSCMFYLLRKVIKNEKLIIALDTLIFVFIFHSSSTFFDNIIWRLPITVALAVLYSKNGSLINTTILHMTYNVVLSLLN